MSTSRFVVVALILETLVFAQAPSSRPGSSSSGAPGTTPPASPSSPSRAAAAPIIVRGRVTRAEDGTPVRTAQVTMNRMGQRDADGVVPESSESSLTDEAGRYEFSVPPGRYQLDVAKSGYLPMSYGTPPGSTSIPLEITAGASYDAVNFALLRGASISGTLFDESGERVAGAKVMLMTVRYQDWQRSLTRSGAEVTTDDRGQYRVFGLRAGQYYVMATAISPVVAGRFATGYGPTFYPGAVVANAAGLITVDTGQQLTGLDFVLAHAPTGEISGTVVKPDGTPQTSGFAYMMRVPSGDALGMSDTIGNTALFRNGKFFFQGLASGTYRIVVISDELRATKDFVFDGQDLKDQTVVLSAGTSVRGQLRPDGGTATLDPKSVRLTLVSPDMSYSVTEAAPEMTDEGAFLWKSVKRTSPVLFRATVNGWALQRVTLNGVDITDTPIDVSKPIEGVEIVLSNRLSEMTGVVSDARGAPAAHVMVVAFAEDEGKWGPGTRFAGQARSNAQGQFSIRGLPPAVYRVIAVNAYENGTETNREQLQVWRSSAMRVPMTAVGAPSIQLRAADR